VSLKRSYKYNPLVHIRMSLPQEVKAAMVGNGKNMLWTHIFKNFYDRKICKFFKIVVI